jgi:hypothetical protein
MIAVAVLVSESGTYSTSTSLDQLGVEANLRSLIDAAVDMASFYHDSPAVVALQAGSMTTEVYRLEHSDVLVVVWGVPRKRKGEDEAVVQDALRDLQQGEHLRVMVRACLEAS